MAASKSVVLPEADINKEIECRVCMEQKTLRILTCGHKCCQECIGDHNSPPSLPATIPSTLKLLSQHDTHNKQCVSVHHHSVSGDILLGGLCGMKIYSRKSGEVTHVVSYPGALVTEYRGEVFISSWSSSKKTVTIYTYDMDSEQSEMIFSFPQKSTAAAYLSVSAQYIAHLDRDNHNNIKLYNRRSGAVSTKQLSALKSPINLLFLPDETLLVTGWDDDRKEVINKYRVREEGEPVLIWSSDQVPRAAGVAVDRRGFIYVSGQDNKTIYILSAEGKKLHEMKLDQLPHNCEDISVRDGELAVVGWNDDNFTLFKLIK